MCQVHWMSNSNHLLIIMHYKHWLLFIKNYHLNLLCVAVIRRENRWFIWLHWGNSLVLESNKKKKLQSPHVHCNTNQIKPSSCLLHKLRSKIMYLRWGRWRLFICWNYILYFCFWSIERWEWRTPQITRLELGGWWSQYRGTGIIRNHVSHYFEQWRLLGTCSAVS